jgi:hypothetical protein
MVQGWTVLLETEPNDELRVIISKVMSFLETEFDLKRRLSK